jgi:hypothetical protein
MVFVKIMSTEHTDGVTRVYLQGWTQIVSAGQVRRGLVSRDDPADHAGDVTRVYLQGCIKITSAAML